MPYIKKEDREEFDIYLDQILGISNKGELEYCIFKLMLIYMQDKKVSYNELHNTTYAAQHCCDEFRRRFLDSREDTAMGENGDVD
jgi:hypothetical protein